MRIRRHMDICESDCHENIHNFTNTVHVYPEHFIHIFFLNTEISSLHDICNPHFQ